MEDEGDTLVETGVIADANLWHINGRSLTTLRDSNETGVVFKDSMDPCDVSVLNESKQLNHPRAAAHKATEPFGWCTPT